MFIFIIALISVAFAGYMLGRLTEFRKSTIEKIERLKEKCF